MSGILATAAKVGGVQRLAIVDDAYDPPQGEEISEDAFNRFVQTMEDHPDRLQEASTGSGLAEADLEDWEAFAGKNALIKSLWNLSVGAAANAQVSAELKATLDILFGDVHADRISKLQQLRPLEDLLATMGVVLMKLGADPEPALVATADVVFLDLFLSSDVPPAAAPGVTPRPVLERARDRALRYLEAVRAETANDVQAIPPAFVLISSMGTTQIASNFRKKADQTASRFRFVSKQAIERNDPQGLLTIAEILRTCRASAMLEPLRKAWPAVVKDAEAWVARQLVDLDISDFARLYELSLRFEGQRVEDYVKELVAGALAERVICAFSSRQPTVGEENPFSEAPSPYMAAPSNAFAELYGATRMTHDKGYRGLAGNDPMSGDLYLEGVLPKRTTTAINGRKVCVVMTPICDLMSRDGKEPAATSVLLLEGTLEPTYHQQKLDPQLISLGGRFYEVDWAIKRPLALPLTTLRNQVRKKEKTWLGRLKSEHFLALQSEYLTSFARVGLLKAPAVFEPLAGKICAYENGTLVTLDGPFDASRRFAFQSPDGKKEAAKQPVFFTGDFLDHFRTVLADVAVGAGRAGPTKAKAKGVLERMEQVVNLVKRQPPGQHTINDYLRVDFLASRNADVPASGEGMVLIALWKP